MAAPDSLNPHTNSTRRGFTLIELLVSISIIALLSSIGLFAYSGAQKTGRDAKRKQDLKSIQIALEAYKQKNGRYPEANPNISPTDAYGNQGSNSSQTPWIVDQGSTPVAFDSTYINILPVDPINNSTYYYQYYSPSVAWGSGICQDPGQYYLLKATLENPKDPDSIGARGKDQIFVCDGKYMYSQDNWPAQLYVLASP